MGLSFISRLAKILLLGLVLNRRCVLSRYIEEHVQKTGVAIETQGFSFVTSGRKRESLKVCYKVSNIAPSLNCINFVHSREFFLLPTFPDNLSVPWYVRGGVFVGPHTRLNP